MYLLDQQNWPICNAKRTLCKTIESFKALKMEVPQVINFGNNQNVFFACWV